METYSVGEMIRTYRENACLTQEELADILQVSKQRLSNWETGFAIPRPAMIARMIGALDIPSEDASILTDAAETARTRRAQEQEALQASRIAKDKEQAEEEERMQHKTKAIKLLIMGAIGFVLGLLFVLVTGSYKDTSWYFPLAIGLSVAGIPFGWDLLTDRSESRVKTYYYGSDGLLIEFIGALVYFILKLVGAFLIGLTVFPVKLFYHAYKAGRKGSVYRIIMCFIFVIVAICVVAFVAAMVVTAV